MELGRSRLHRLQFDRDMLIRIQVLAKPQLAKIAAADLLADAVVGPDHELGAATRRARRPLVRRRAVVGGTLHHAARRVRRIHGRVVDVAGCCVAVEADRRVRIRHVHFRSLVCTGGHRIPSGCVLALVCALRTEGC